MVNNNIYPTTNNSFRLSHLIIRLKYDWCLGMARPWLRCFLILFFISSLIFIYASLNVSSVEIKSSNSLTSMITPKFGITNKLTFNVQDNSLKYSNYQEKCSIIHIAMVCSGYNSTRSLITVVKSILFYRSKPLHFHFIIDQIANRTLKVLFDTWNLPQVNVSFYSDNIWIPKVSWIPNKHYSGVYGLLKLILPEILTDINRVLVLDTDVTVLTDLTNLWNNFDDFNNNKMLGLVENQSDWYKKILGNGISPWPAIGNGFNTGVILMDLKRLRERNFFNLWMKTCENVLKEYYEVSLADQDIINAVIKDDPSIVFTLDCTWNVQLSDRTMSDQCYNNAKQIQILHWNSPRKQDVLNKHVKDFNRMHRVFLEMDGNLLRRPIFGCETVENISFAYENDVCQNFTKGSTLIYRTHLFLREYQYNPYLNTDIGLVTQCSADRIQLLDELSKRWPGTISIAVYLTDAEVQSFIDFIQSSDALRNRKNIAYHIVYKDGEFYPINYLRNIAISQISTPYIFQLDIDFLPQIDLYEKLMGYIVKLNITQSDKKAVIVPAFETQRYRFTFPATKDELLKYLNSGILYTFRYHVWAKGHASTNYSFWKTANEPYEISWEPDFEPYIIVPKISPLYDERFIGFGWNKVSYITHLTALGYKYIVLPDAFIIHRPHAPSLDIGKFRTDVKYRRCLKKLKDKFVGELIAKYGDDALSRIKKITKE